MTASAGTICPPVEGKANPAHCPDLVVSNAALMIEPLPCKSWMLGPKFCLVWFMQNRWIWKTIWWSGYIDSGNGSSVKPCRYVMSLSKEKRSLQVSVLGATYEQSLQEGQGQVVALRKHGRPTERGVRGWPEDLMQDSSTAWDHCLKLQRWSSLGN